MKSIAMFLERATLLNEKSALSVALLSLSATVLCLIRAPYNGPLAGAIVVAAIAIYLALAMAGSRTRIDRTHVVMGFFPYQKRVKVSDLCITKISMLQQHEEPFLRLRRNGIGLPGMQMGWFSTSSGKPVFAAVSGRRDRVLIPTMLDYDLLVTSRRPQDLLHALHMLASAETE